jgi:MFS family permease
LPALFWFGLKIPIAQVFAKNTKALVLGTFASVTTFLLFYLLTVFCLSWGTSVLHFTKTSLLIGLLIAILFFAIGIPLSASLADRFGRRKILLIATAGIFLFGLGFSPIFSTGSWAATDGFLILGLFLMGLTYGPLGTALAEIFPAPVRYTGSSLAFTLAGILGASLTPAIATTLATRYGLPWVGYYLSAAAGLTFLALLAAGSLMKRNFGEE